MKRYEPQYSLRKMVPILDGDWVKYSDAIDKATSMYKKGKEDAELKYEQKCSECIGTGQKPEASDDEAMLQEWDRWDYSGEGDVPYFSDFCAGWRAALKHARQSQDTLFGDLFQSFSELLDDAIEERRQKYGEFQGGPEKYYQADIALRDRIRQELGKKGE